MGSLGLKAARRSRRKVGLTLIEITLAIAVIGGIMLATASAFSSTIKVTDQASRTTRAAVFFEATMENVAAQNYDNLLTLDANTVFDATNANDSEYSVTLTVFLAQVDLIQINAVLTDLQTGRIAGRVTTLRSRR